MKWIKMREALPPNDCTAVCTAYESYDGRISEPDQRLTTGAVINRMAAVYGTSPPTRETGSRLVWQLASVMVLA